MVGGQRLKALDTTHFYNRERGFAVAGLFAASAVLWWLVCLPRALLWALCGGVSFWGWRQWVGGLVG